MTLFSPFPFDDRTAFLYTLATTGAVAVTVMLMRYVNLCTSPTSRKLLHICTFPCMRYHFIAMAPVFILCWPMFPNTERAKCLAMSSTMRIDENNAAVPFLFTAVFWIVGRDYIHNSLIVNTMSRSGKPSELTVGPVQYGLIMTLVTYFYWKRVAAIFVILTLSFGDGFSSLFGTIRKGNRSLWWNPSKTWYGLIAYVVFSSLGIIGWCAYFQM